MNAWLRKAFLGWLSWAAVVLFVALPVSADETLLMQAAKKWEAAELTEAAKLYQQALDEGGLYPSDVLVAYTRIGTVQAATNQQNLALSSFRVAASIDPSFELPSEAGKKAQALYRRRAPRRKSPGVSSRSRPRCRRPANRDKRSRSKPTWPLPTSRSSRTSASRCGILPYPA
ncbi:MAG TPA: hypothetical protein PLI95_25835 [Polyangiaceae bacterium]|nr:hypothetical protein [Polyangiaceae bacterium]